MGTPTTGVKPRPRDGQIDEAFVRAALTASKTVELSDHVIYETRPANVAVSAMQIESSNHIQEPAQIHLTPTEWQLLQTLVRHPGRLVSQRQLLQEGWGPTYVEQTHYLRQYFKALRHKLEDDSTRPRHLSTEPGMGYRFQP
jgi:two-component system, OmpR family, KDP operon response regulator KdpE